MLKKIISDGYTRADQAALDAAIHIGIPHGGWISRGRKTDSGVLAEKYNLKELESVGLTQIKKQNVIESDGTLILFNRKPCIHAEYSNKHAGKFKLPCLSIDLSETPEFNASVIIADWLLDNRIQVLNVVGSNIGKDPGFDSKIVDIIESVYYLCITRYPLADASDSSMVEKVVNEIISEMSLKEKSSIAKMNEDTIDSLASVFRPHIKNKIGVEPEDENEYSLIIRTLWEKLQSTHKLRIVK